MRLYESPQDNLNSWRKLCPKPAKSKGEPERRKTVSVARKKIDAGLLSNLTKKCVICYKILSVIHILLVPTHFNIL